MTELNCAKVASLRTGPSSFAFLTEWLFVTGSRGCCSACGSRSCRIQRLSCWSSIRCPGTRGLAACHFPRCPSGLESNGLLELHFAIQPQLMHRAWEFPLVLRPFYARHCARQSNGDRSCMHSLSIHRMTVGEARGIHNGDEESARRRLLEAPAASRHLAQSAASNRCLSSTTRSGR